MGRASVPVFQIVSQGSKEKLTPLAFQMSQGCIAPPSSAGRHILA